MSKPEGRRSFLYDNMLRIMRNHGVIKLHSYRTLNGAGFISELCDFIDKHVSQRELQARLDEIEITKNAWHDSSNKEFAKLMNDRITELTARKPSQ